MCSEACRIAFIREEIKLQEEVGEIGETYGSSYLEGRWLGWGHLDVGRLGLGGRLGCSVSITLSTPF